MTEEDLAALEQRLEALEAELARVQTQVTRLENALLPHWVKPPAPSSGVVTPAEVLQKLRQPFVKGQEEE